MEQLLAIREPGREPEVQGWRDHAAVCAVCSAELDRLDQRAARLRALPPLLPARSRLADVQAGFRRHRLRRRLLTGAVGSLALAATLALAVVWTPSGPSAAELAEQEELENIIARSRQLEQVIEDYDPDRRVTDGRTAVVTASLEDRLARVDRELQLMNLMDQRVPSQEALRLWRERVGLLDALVDVHATGARFVRY
jgi:hypothetical protein